jgi:NADPH:quinone reductase-like Zn-dependent oxidoreductase
MKAVLYDRQLKPEPFRIGEIECPAIQDDELLVQIVACSVNALDYRSIQMGSIPKNKIFGADIAGRVKAKGKLVTRFAIGDAVFGDISDCGLGGFAEFVAVPERYLVAIPKGVSFQDAAALPVSASTALCALRKYGPVQPNQHVLIYGAGGGVGTFAVQLAKHFGAKVTAVCGTNNVALVKSLGADEVVDYHHENILDRDTTYDLILAINGKQPLRKYWRALTKHGACVMVGGALSQIFKALFFGTFFSLGSRKLRALMAKSNPTDLSFLIDLVQQGAIHPVIDQILPLEDAAKAVKYLASGHARGKVVLAVSESPWSDQ